ncbi:MAG: hypothetical protein V1706_04200 [Pseudomonadota bacterium]
MRIVQAVRLGAWSLVGLNLLMALGSIAIFMRMAPAITVIIDRNERSLQACEDMLASLALSDNITANEERVKIFKEAFIRAKNNVTEIEEPAVLRSIEATADSAFHGDIKTRKSTVDAIVNLGKINREAMISADSRARQLGHAGAWGVVFMAVSVFVAGMIFIRGLTHRVIKSLEEIHAVITAWKNGETLRRCTGTQLPQEIRVIFSGINEILDQCQIQGSIQPHVSGENGNLPSAIKTSRNESR